ncbi:MAG: hypothetical protein LBM76_03135 [Mycoplasmataceae bacterium]|jgi:ATP synthase F1 epsilon subunit|nr:hypothetical protein [Mycoplasmataceae bacterium]
MGSTEARKLSIHLQVNTPNGSLFEDNVYSVEIKTSSGYMSILPNHIPMIGSIVPSKIFIIDLKNNKVPAVISDGLFSTDGKKLVIVTDFFDFTKNITTDAITVVNTAINNAVKNKSIKDFDYHKFQVAIEEKMNQIKKLSK